MKKILTLLITTILSLSVLFTAPAYAQGEHDSRDHKRQYTKHEQQKQYRNQYNNKWENKHNRQVQHRNEKQYKTVIVKKVEPRKTQRTVINLDFSNALLGLLLLQHNNAPHHGH